MCMYCSTTVRPKTSTFPKPVTWDGSSMTIITITFTKPHEIIAITSILPVSRESVCRSEQTDYTHLAVYAVSTQPATIDFRKLNQQVPLSRWPMTQLDQEIPKMKSSMILSTLDVASRFWTIPVHPDDQHKLAFTFGNQQYTLTWCPFG